MIKIHNVRLGHACNSSSTHSLIAMADRNRSPSVDHGNAMIMAQHFGTICKQLPEAFAHILYQDLVAPLYPDYVNISDLREDDLDGEWEINFRDFAKNPKGLEFVKMLFKEMCSSNVNFFYGESGIDDQKLSKDPVAQPVLNLVNTQWLDIKLRHDEENGFWSIYNKSTGTKLRVSFDALERVRATKSSTPELVDVKITDFCDKGCQYCYQGSTPKGAHASVDDLKILADALAELEVFEVALGGGEPFSHPNFGEIVEIFYSRGITPNVTTAPNWSTNRWFNDESCYKMLGATAVSINARSDLDKLCKILQSIIKKNFDYNPRRMVIQHVVGTLSLEQTVNLLVNNYRTLYEHGIEGLTLLGFKQTNRGLAFVPKVHHYDPFDLVSRFLEQCSYIDVSVDTAFIAQHESSVRRIIAHHHNKITNINDQVDNDDEALFTREEGKFSMYVDAVTKMAGKSSYHLDTFVPLKDFSSRSIINAFQKW